MGGAFLGDGAGALWMGLYAFPGASSDQPKCELGTADLGNSARLYLDVVSGNAVFERPSGHDYATVPEPAAALLLAAGAAVLGAGARRRRERIGPPRPVPAVVRFTFR